MDYIKQVWASSGVVRALVCFIVAGCALALSTAERPPVENAPAASPGIVERVIGWLSWRRRPTMQVKIEDTAGRIIDQANRGLDKFGQVVDRVERRSDESRDSQLNALSDSSSR